MSTDLVTVQLDRARQALIEAKTLQETKRVLDVAAAAEIYARRQQLGEEAIGYAHEIKIEALAQLGRLLAEIPKQNGARGLAGGGTRGSRKEPQVDSPPRLSDLGITKKTSMIAQQLASLPDDTRQEIARQEKTVAEAMKEARRDERIERIAEVAARPISDLESLARFPVIYADPPWKYDFMSVDAWKVENHYPTMATDEICALKIPEICTPDAILFLWATAPKLADAMEVIRAWGFTYKTCAIWDKEWTGMGNYFRVQHELLLIATRGAIPPPETDNRPASIVKEKRSTKHSEKPAIFYSIIEQMYPTLPKVELFARKLRDGWSAWGLEAE